MDIIMASKAISNSPLNSSPLSRNGLRSALNNYYERRRVLTVPPEILNNEANKDKHFCFIRYKDTIENGGFNDKGFQPYVVDHDSEKQHLKSDFTKSTDGFIHRREMILGWMPKSEYEEIQAMKKLLRDRKYVNTYLSEVIPDAGIKKTATQEEL